MSAGDPVKRSRVEELRDLLNRLGGGASGATDQDQPWSRGSLRVPNSERETRTTAAALALGGPLLLLAATLLLGSGGALLYALGAVVGGALAYYLPPRPFKSFVAGSPSRMRPTPQNILSPNEIYLTVFLERDTKNAWIWATISVALALLLALLGGDGWLENGLLQDGLRLFAGIGGALATLGFAHAASLWRAYLIAGLDRDESPRNDR